MSFEIVGIKLVAEEGSYFATMTKADKAVVNFGDTADRTFRQMPSLADIATGALHRIGAMAIDVFAQAGQAAVGFITDSIGAAGDFEAGMNRFAAAAGDGLEKAGIKSEDFRDLFIQIGKELPVSTSEVQDAAIELIKGGIDPLILKTGGLKDTIQFAAAAELDLVEASEIAVKQLGVWTDASASAEEQTKFLAMSQDLMVKTAGASTLSVDGLAAGMNNAGGQARALNLNYRDFITSMALVSPAFSSAEQAGTGFNVFLKQLQPSTKPAQKAMRELGLFTDETGSAFFNTKGQYVGTKEAAELLQKATAGLTDAKKAEYLQTIFGIDGMVAANTLINAGAKGYDILSEKIDNASGIQATATLKQAGFNTALNNFKGSIEALQITIGTVLLPILTDLFNNYLAPGINILTDLATQGFIADETFSKLNPTLQGVIQAIDGFITGLQTAWAVIQPVVNFISGNLIPILSGLASALLAVVVPAFVTWATAAGAAAIATITALAPVILPIVAIGAAVAVLVKIWESDWLGIRTAVMDFWNTTGKPIFNQLVNWLSVTIPAAIRVLADFWNNTLLPALTVIWNFISTKLAPLFMALVKVEIALMVAAVKSLAALWTDLLAPAIEVVYDWFNTYMIPEFQAANENIAIVAGAIRDTLGPAFNWLGDHVLNPVVDWFSNINEKIENAIGWLNDLADTIRNLPSLPDAFVGHSPPPMAEWFNAIGMGAANAAIGIGAVGSTVQSVPANPMALMAGGSTANTYNQNRNVNLNYQTTYAPPVNQSLAIARALA